MSVHVFVGGADTITSMEGYFGTFETVEEGKDALKNRIIDADKETRYKYYLHWAEFVDVKTMVVVLLLGVKEIEQWIPENENL